MKTNGSAPAQVPPGNLSTAQLAATLAHTPRAGEGQSAAQPATEAGREPANTEANRKPAEGKPEPQKQTKETKRKAKATNVAATTPDATAAEAPSGAANTAAAIEPEEPATTEEPTEPAAEPTAEEPTEPAAEEPTAEEPAEQEQEQEQGQEQEPARAGLPAELKDAMEIARGDGKTGVAKLLKRVHTLADERDTQRNARLQAEEQLSQVRAELNEARQTAGAAANGNGNGRANGELAHPEVAKVAQELATVDHWLEWCEENTEGGKVPDGKGGEVELDAAKVRKLHRDLNGQRTELAARKVQTEGLVKQAYDGQYQQFHQAAAAVGPWLNDPKSSEYQEMQAILKMVPQLKASPDYELVMAHYFAGRTAWEAQQRVKASAAAAKKNGAKPAPARVPTRVATEAGTSGVDQTPKGEREAANAGETFAKSGKTADLAKMFAARARAVSR